MKVIITMAGAGSRCRDAGFSCPKHEIEVRGMTLFEWAVTSLTHFFANDFIFICRKSDNTESFIFNKTAKLGIESIRVIEVDYLTKGQAATVLLAADMITEPGEEILVYNIDTYVERDFLKPEYIKGDGWLPAFKAQGDRWSFIRFNNDFRVLEAEEKVRISEFGTVGLYYFKSFELYKHCYKNFDFSAYKEQYTAPLYNVLIRDPRFSVYTSIIPEESVHVLGTPEDVLSFYPQFRIAG